MLNKHDKVRDALMIWTKNNAQMYLCNKWSKFNFLYWGLYLFIILFIYLYDTGAIYQMRNQTEKDRIWAAAWKRTTKDKIPVYQI